ncbi:MAG: hypothetical protein ABJ388_17885 [Alphaproteobacteria bacterium]|uniref:hypothetical protein n=1 Tax=Roseibium sp. TaxID=1936156 RepID=UPI00327F543D|tara:strand:- start:33 stop:332 length:300 start_codon:yes stop_codon:yes gene_type:complete
MNNMTDTILKTRAPFYALAFAALLGVAGANGAQAAEYREDSTINTEAAHSHGNDHIHDSQSMKKAGEYREDSSVATEMASSDGQTHEHDSQSLDQRAGD